MSTEEGERDGAVECLRSCVDTTRRVLGAMKELKQLTAGMRKIVVGDPLFKAVVAADVCAIVFAEKLSAQLLEAQGFLMQGKTVLEDRSCAMNVFEDELLKLDSGAEVPSGAQQDHTHKPW